MTPRDLPDFPATFRLDTERMTLRCLTRDDAAFILELVNDPGWKRFIGDRGLVTVEQAATYLENGPIAMYARLGFGLWRMGLKDGDEPVGICGLIKRDSLVDVDLGYALLPAHRGQGYAEEAARACLDHGWQVLGLQRIVAITSPDNERSSRLLERVGFRFEGPVALQGDDRPTHLYAAACPR